MATDEKPTEPSQDAPLTKEQFEARARAAGWGPFQTMLEAYAERGRAIVASVLAALEDDSPKQKKA